MDLGNQDQWTVESGPQLWAIEPDDGDLKKIKGVLGSGEDVANELNCTACDCVCDCDCGSCYP